MGNVGHKGKEVDQDHIAQAKKKVKENVDQVITNLRQKLGEEALSIVVLGASGHLAKIKTYPALFKLYQLGVLPKTANIIGYARSDLDMKSYHERISTKLKFKDEAEEKGFLSMCIYHRGQYDSPDDFKKLNDKLEEIEAETAKTANRLFYYAIPPTVFAGASKAIKTSAMCKTGWTRCIIEKPFGRDLETSNELAKAILDQLEEKQIFRIDHYLAKELIQNLLALRFSNPVFRAIWSREYISCVRISFKEDAGVEGRGGYYDQFGAIRDVMQNHLLQVLSLVAMEQPKSLTDDAIRDAKVAVLKQIKSLTMDRVVTGQYIKNGDKPGYLDDKTVNKESVTETFCQFVTTINNSRWKGVPFICKAGKALDERRAEVRVQFRQPQDSVYPDSPGNELVLRIQPNEAIWMRVNAKKPGLSSFNELVHAELDLTYQQRFDLQDKLPDAYTRLILDALRGDHSLFVRTDELAEAWRIFTPILHQIVKDRIKPIPYVRGTRGPEEADKMGALAGYLRPPKEYTWPYTKVESKSSASHVTVEEEGEHPVVPL